MTSLSVPSASPAAYLAEVGVLLERIPQASLTTLYGALLQAYSRDAQIFVVGNGGSAATATHFACDLSKNTRAMGQRRVRALALTDNLACLTAWANDDGYSSVFAEQLLGLLRSGDLLVAISGSGASPNILDAVRCATAGGAATVALTGHDGGLLAPMVDHALIVPSPCMPMIEDVHLAVCHALTAALRAHLQSLDAAPEQGTPAGDDASVLPVLQSSAG